MWDTKADVLVVGAGAAGCIAAGVAAADPALEVVVLEKDTGQPCNSTIASAFIPGAGSRFQRAKGIADDPAILAEDIWRKSKGRADKARALTLARRSADAVHWLADVPGIPIEHAPEIEWFGHTRPRMHSHPIRSGIPIIATLRAYLAAQPNVTFLDKVPAIDLLADGGIPIGVVARGERERRIAARRIVLACGGFGGNPEMVARYIPEMATAWHIGGTTNTGEGIRWGLALGAAVEHMGAYQGRDTIREDGTRVTPGVVTGGGIAIDVGGQRFVREDRDYSELAAVYRQQPGGFVVLIWDAGIQHSVDALHVMQEAKRNGGIDRFESLRALAHHHGLSENVLGATLDDYNRGVLARKDGLGRTELTRPLAPPYFTARVTGAIAHTQGGLKVDDRQRVLRQDGRAIEPLYAVGNTAVGVSGSDAGGYMSGNGLMVAFSSGLIAGEDASATLAPA